MPELIFLIILCGYFIQSVLFVIGAKKKFPHLKDDDLPTAAVIVSARDEEDKILNCLESLNKLEYPSGKLQIMIVDDRSEDNTGAIIDDFIEGLMGNGWINKKLIIRDKKAIPVIKYLFNKRAMIPNNINP